MTDLIRGNLERIDFFQREKQRNLRIRMLREAGCECKKPLIGWRPNVGPRCRLCNTVAEIPDANFGD